MSPFISTPIRYAQVEVPVKRNGELAPRFLARRRFRLRSPGSVTDLSLGGKEPAMPTPAARRAHQPEGVGVVLRGHRRRAMPGGRHLVASSATSARWATPRSWRPCKSQQNRRRGTHQGPFGQEIFIPNGPGITFSGRLVAVTGRTLA